MSNNIVQFNEEIIKGQIKELVRGSVEETLNELLEAEAEKLTQAARYERSEARQGYRSGHYDRNLTTTSGNVTLHVPRLKGISFETAIIERYRRRESSVEEALIEMYLAGVSVRRVEDITEALWGSKVSASLPLRFPTTVSPSQWPTSSLDDAIWGCSSIDVPSTIREVTMDSFFSGVQLHFTTGHAKDDLIIMVPKK